MIAMYLGPFPSQPSHSFSLLGLSRSGADF